MRTFLVVFVSFAQAAVVQAAYPSEYPFTKESLKPPIPRKSSLGDPSEGSPTLASDPGGYMRRAAMCDPYSEARPGCKGLTDCPSGFYPCGMNNYITYVKKRVDPKTYKIPLGTNCTASKPTQIVTDDTTLGVMAGKTICSPSKCCTKWKGARYLSNVWKGRHESWSDTITTGTCPLPMNEEAYCTIVIGQIFKCLEYIPKPTNDRANTVACYDSLWRYLISCPVFKATRELGELALNLEPTKYLESLSIVELATLTPIFTHMDRVCHPYSYFNPEAAAPPSSATVIAVGMSFMISIFAW